MPSGEYWEAYRTLYEMNNALLRLVALPPGAPRAAVEALTQAVERLAHDKEFAAESMKIAGIRAGIRDRARPERAGAQGHGGRAARCATTSTTTRATFRRSEDATEDADEHAR